MFTLLLDNKLFLAPIGPNPQVSRAAFEAGFRRNHLLCPQSVIDPAAACSGCGDGDGNMGNVCSVAPPNFKGHP